MQLFLRQELQSLGTNDWTKLLPKGRTFWFVVDLYEIIHVVIALSLAPVIDNRFTPEDILKRLKIQLLHTTYLQVDY